jgi:hypothetical protein
MIFAASFSVREGSHLVAGFGQEAVVFGAAFFDARLGSGGPKRDEIAGDGQQHIVNERGNGAGFSESSRGGVCE